MHIGAAKAFVPEPLSPKQAMQVAAAEQVKH